MVKICQINHSGLFSLTSILNMSMSDDSPPARWGSPDFNKSATPSLVLLPSSSSSSSLWASTGPDLTASGSSIRAISLQNLKVMPRQTRTRTHDEAPPTSPSRKQSLKACQKAWSFSQWPSQWHHGGHNINHTLNRGICYCYSIYIHIYYTYPISKKHINLYGWGWFMALCLPHETSMNHA